MTYQCHYCKRDIDRRQESYWQFYGHPALKRTRNACNDCAAEMNARAAVARARARARAKGAA